MNTAWTDRARSTRLALAVAAAVCSIPCTAHAQNLVPNHSFEVPDSCPGRHTFLTEEEGPLFWFSGGGTPDFYQSCVPPPNEASVPQNDFAFQYPQDGENYIGLVTYEVNSGGIREYAMVQLTEPLVPSQLYTVSFYANAAWNGTDSLLPQNYLASSHIGALFTMQPRPWSSNDPWPLATGNAHVWHPWIIADTVNWILVGGSFVADSAYRYLMVGNHFDNSVTDTLHFGTYLWSPKAYTLIDNVCVSQGLDGCPRANGVVAPEGDEVLLAPNPAMDELVLLGLSRTATGVIRDATGREMWHGRLEPVRSRLAVGSWARGYYVLTISVGEDHRSLKFVLTE